MVVLVSTQQVTRTKRLQLPKYKAGGSVSSKYLNLPY